MLKRGASLRLGRQFLMGEATPVGSYSRVALVLAVHAAVLLGCRLPLDTRWRDQESSGRRNQDLDALTRVRGSLLPDLLSRSRKALYNIGAPRRRRPRTLRQGLETQPSWSSRTGRDKASPCMENTRGLRMARVPRRRLALEHGMSSRLPRLAPDGRGRQQDRVDLYCVLSSQPVDVARTD